MKILTGPASPSAASVQLELKSSTNCHTGMWVTILGNLERITDGCPVSLVQDIVRRSRPCSAASQKATVQCAEL
jgi:hypothetical protein